MPKSAKNNAKYIVCAFGVPKPVIFGADVFAPMEKSAGVFESLSIFKIVSSYPVLPYIVPTLHSVDSNGIMPRSVP